MSTKSVEEFCKNDAAPLVRECSDCIDKYIILAQRYAGEHTKLLAELKAKELQIEGMQSVRDKLSAEIQFREKCILEAMAERDVALRLNGELRTALQRIYDMFKNDGEPDPGVSTMVKIAEEALGVKRKSE